MYLVRVHSNLLNENTRETHPFQFHSLPYPLHLYLREFIGAELTEYIQFHQHAYLPTLARALATPPFVTGVPPLCYHDSTLTNSLVIRLVIISINSSRYARTHTRIFGYSNGLRPRCTHATCMPTYFGVSRLTHLVCRVCGCCKCDWVPFGRLVMHNYCMRASPRMRKRNKRRSPHIHFLLFLFLSSIPARLTHTADTRTHSIPCCRRDTIARIYLTWPTNLDHRSPLPCIVPCLAHPFRA